MAQGNHHHSTTSHLQHRMTSHRWLTQIMLYLLVATMLFMTTVLVAASNSNPLFTAVQLDDEARIQSAVKSDPSLLNTKGVGGQTPLVHAVLTGKFVAVKTLLALDADTSLTEKDGYNILHAAGFQGRAEILDYLLKNVKGLNPTVDKHNDGYFPLHRACWGRESRHAETVKVFLEHGVPPNLKADNGKTCLEMTSNPATKTVIDEWTSKMSEDGDDDEEDEDEDDDDDDEDDDDEDDDDEDEGADEL